MIQKKGALPLLELINRLTGIDCGVVQFKFYIYIFMASSMHIKLFIINIYAQPMARSVFDNKFAPNIPTCKVHLNDCL